MEQLATYFSAHGGAFFGALVQKHVSPNDVEVV